MSVEEFQPVLNFARITKCLLSIESEINGLAYGFENNAEITSLDEALIDQLVFKASGLSSSAEDLKDIIYTPPAT